MMKKGLFKIAFSLPAAMLLLMASSPGILAQDREDARIERGLERVTDMLRLIRENFVRELAPDGLVDGAIGGMLSQLDPHSTYLNPDQTKQMLAEQRGEYSGVGLTVTNREGRLTVVSAIEDGPGARQGIRTGDVITNIDGVPTSESDYESNVRKLRGAQGTKVTITIEREGIAGTFDVQITRERVSLRSISYAFMLDGVTGYIRLTRFARNSHEEMAEAIDMLKSRGMQQLIFDLRSNPGGDLDAAVGVSDLFLDEGLIVYTKGLAETSREDYVATTGSTHWSGPLVVLINRGSASGSEVVAGALQDHDRALVVGEKSWGKGLVQSVYPLSYGASLSLTTAKYYTPSGRLIQRPYTPGAFDNYFNDDSRNTERRMQQARTDLGRIVYGGDGIAPDELVTEDDISFLSQQILFKGMIFDFVTRYLSNNPATGVNFRADEAVMNDFEQFVRDSDLEFIEDSWQRDRNFLAMRISQEVVTRKAGSQAGYRAILEMDKQLQAALKYCEEARALLKRKMREIG